MLKKKRRHRSWTTTIVVVIARLVFLWNPGNILSVINSGNDKGYIACVSGDRDIMENLNFCKNL